MLAHLLCLADKNMFNSSVIQDMLKDDLALEAAKNLNTIYGELKSRARILILSWYLRCQKLGTHIRQLYMTQG